MGWHPVPLLHPAHLASFFNAVFIAYCATFSVSQGVKGKKWSSKVTNRSVRWRPLQVCLGLSTALWTLGR